MADPTTPKPVHKSRTIQSFAAGLATAATLLILHFTGVRELDAGGVEASVTATVFSVIGIVLRLVTSQPIGSPDPGE